MPGKPRSTRNPSTILLLGAGRMGFTLLKGWVAQRIGPVVVVEPHPSAELKRVAKANSIALAASLEDVDPARVAVCVVAIKPQILRGEAVKLRSFAEKGALILSIAAGTSIASLGKACGASARIIRAMPNLPGAIGEGISALYAPRRISVRERQRAQSLLAALGDTVWVTREELIDVVTAVSGSGPAYVFLMAEAMARAGQAEGLPEALALRLARATISGAGALLKADSRPADSLRKDVTSPGGTTEAALRVLMQDDALAGLMAKAVAAARRRAEELRS